VALATAPGTAAIAVIRVSGPRAIEIVASLWQGKDGKALEKHASHTVHLGWIVEDDKRVDEVLVTLFKAPRSYTGEEVVEISCHGSAFVQREILQILLRNGCRMAQAGEFTLRAFLNGKMDLSQAEAVADLIASDSAASHQLAVQQMRGGFSSEIAELRQQLLNFASLIELELDFSEEDVEFADRSDLKNLLSKIEMVLKGLIDSFASGNALKEGIPVAIVGEPNVGKSTLLNALLNEERAIVSDIAGTTRDTIEDEIVLGGVSFRFIDTAGIRETSDTIESLGIERTYEKMQQARLVLLLLDAKASLEPRYVESQIEKLTGEVKEKAILVRINKTDLLDGNEMEQLRSILNDLELPASVEIGLLSAKTKAELQDLIDRLLALVDTGILQGDGAIVTNSRHYDALGKSLEAIKAVQIGLSEGLSGDLLAVDLRQALHHLGEITGEVTNDELLGNIFANFCIGK
jgi:tRNA modification GTPase